MTQTTQLPRSQEEIIELIGIDFVNRYNITFYDNQYGGDIIVLRPHDNFISIHVDDILGFELSDTGSFKIKTEAMYLTLFPDTTYFHLTLFKTIK